MEPEQKDLIKKTRAKMWIGLALIVVLGLAVAVYFIFINPIESGDNEENTESDASVLVTERVGGGLCVTDSGDSYGCNSLFTLNFDGKYYITSDQNGQTVDMGSGQITRKELNDLKDVIDATNFAEIKQHPFTDTCPTAYDGAASTYTFYFSDLNSEEISSCEYDISSGYPVFGMIDEIVNKYSEN